MYQQCCGDWHLVLKAVAKHAKGAAGSAGLCSRSARGRCCAAYTLEAYVWFLVQFEHFTCCALHLC
jgi:hypothetical protein